MSEVSIFKKKSFYIVLVLILAVAGYMIYVKIMNDRYEKSQKGAATENARPVGNIGRDDTYSIYLEKYKDAARPDNEIKVDVLGYTAAGNVEKWDGYEGKKNVLVSREGGYAEWAVNVPEAGLYNINLDYYPITSKGIDIERTLLINGEVPFSGADTLTFSRVWKDGGGIKKDNRGNEIRPTQIEVPRWENTYLKDYMGYFIEPYLFYLKEGSNVIRLNADSEPVAIANIVICQYKNAESYNEYIAFYDLDKFKNAELNFAQKIQGEDAAYKSSPTLFAAFDRASSITDPYSTSKIKLNYIGGGAWRVSGQWIEWEFEVPEDGLYNISFKARQLYSRGMVSTRKLTIDGGTPFTDAAELEFKYCTGWKLVTLADAGQNPYKLPLTKGKHVIRLEVTLGKLGSILTQIEDSVYRLNSMYRKILVLTGSKPDQYRDYRIDQVYPEVITAMQKEAGYLDDIVKQMVDYTGQKGSETAVAANMSNQLKRFVKNPDTIPRTMENFQLNISSLGTAIQNLSSSNLDIDCIYINAAGSKLPQVRETFFGKVDHELKCFAASFFEDYSTIGNTYKGETVDVWILSGRDQAAILKNLIDEDFSTKNKIGVNVKLIDSNTLLPAVVAGTGPDVALTVFNNIPVEYALRDAVVDLTQFDDFKEVASQFDESAFTPMTFNGGVYGLPETQIFNVMFYRKDILENELGLKIPEDLPETWDDVIKLFSNLQKNNMQFALPSSEREINGVKSPDTSAMMAMIYQNGGTLYTKDQKKTLLDEEKSVGAFELYTRMFTHYGLPQKYDFVNRFRSGEMPIGIADYNNYNTLSVFAPEIRGLWDFALMPGTVKEDGSVDHSVSCWGQSSIMLKGAKNYEAAWTFLKWWADSKTVVSFSRELESLIGSSARYSAANRAAFDELAWSSENAEIIKKQWDWVVGTPNVAGGYSTSRHLINAFRKVTYSKEDPRETLLDYSRTINDEIKYKRKELGMDAD